MDSLNSLDWSSPTPSMYHDTVGPLRPVEATTRGHGALRYQCPVNGSLVLVTDDATLARLNRRRARLRCIDCGEMHLLTRNSSRTISSSISG